MASSTTFNELLRARVFTLRLLWAAMTLTVLFFVVLAYFLSTQNQISAPSLNDELIRLILYAISAGAAVISFLLRRLLLSNRRIHSAASKDIDLRSLTTDAETGQTDEVRLAKLKSLNPGEMNAFRLTGNYFTSMLLSLALHEVIAVCGLLLSLGEGKFETIIPFAIAAIALNLLVFPRLDKFLERNTPMMAQF